MSNAIQTIQTIRIPLKKIHPSPTNPRKTFDDVKLQELAVSIAEHDVIQAIKVRPHPTLNGGNFMLVIGERRWRASEIAGLADIPAIVENLTDTEVIEQQLVENTHRVDVHPLEEAAAYQALLDHHGYDIDKLIAKTGKSKAHLYGRMKLGKLAPGPKKALLEGKLPVAHAELIARLGDPKLQELCTKVVLGKDLHKITLGDEDGPDASEDLEQLGIQPELFNDSDKHGSYPTIDHAQLLSFRATQKLIRQKFTTQLGLAKFDPADATLTSAGACTGCEHRSGKQPELPGMPTPKGDDLCLRPSCFAEKNNATWKTAAAAATARGLEVVEPVDAKRVFAYDGVSIAGDSPFVELDTQLPYDLAKSPGSKQTFGKLLGKHSAEIPRVLVQDQSGAPRELLDKNAAVKKLRELGKIDKPEKPKASSSGSSKSSAEDEKKAREREEAKKIATETALTKVLEKVAAAGAADLGKKEIAWWRWFALHAVSSSSFGEEDLVLERRGLKKSTDLEDLIEKAKTVGEIRSIVFEFVVCSVSSCKTGGWAPKGYKDRFDDALKLTGVDWDKTLDATKEEIKKAQKFEAEVDAKIEASKKSPAKKKGKSK